MAVIDMAAAKKTLQQNGVKMPWEKGHEEQLEKRSPNAKAEVEAINERENNLLDDAQRKVIEQVVSGRKTKEGKE